MILIIIYTHTGTGKKLAEKRKKLKINRRVCRYL